MGSVERGQSNGKSEGDELANASARYLTSGHLLAAIHAGDDAAIREFFLLYAPLLRDQARRLSIGPDERDEFVTTLLDDLVLHLMEHQLVPRHLTHYVVAALRNRARNRHRDLGRRKTARESAYGDVSGWGQRIIAECHSEYGVRASDPGSADSPVAQRESIAKLCDRVRQQLTPVEMEMLIRVGHHVPLREVAAQMGITYTATRVRLHRLRDRFRRIAIEYARTLKQEERQELESFFRRANVALTRGQAGIQREKSNGKL
jgi:DNA-directed RNA polymerase specialized sigma24 family protein